MNLKQFKAGGIVLDLANDCRLLSSNETPFADLPYSYGVAGTVNTPLPLEFADDSLEDMSYIEKSDSVLVRGSFRNSLLIVEQRFEIENDSLSETISISNASDHHVEIKEMTVGFACDIESRKDWHLCAVPFRIQLDGKVHDYAARMLSEGACENSVHPNLGRRLPDLTEDRTLRSEAWAWGTAEQGVLIIKYNNKDIEQSVVRLREQKPYSTIVFGGAGYCLYGEPSSGRSLKAGESFTFGKTLYKAYRSGLQEAFYAYRSYIDEQGHGFSEEYNPPVNWNVLYDVGWHHSDAEKLKEHYTRDALMEQASFAKECGCELLYLDPGWEIAEGTTLWDENRLGPVPEFVGEMRERFGLKVGYRTILFAHHKHDLSMLWPSEYQVNLFPNKETEKQEDPAGEFLRGICAINSVYLKEKMKRILDISRHGIAFMMFDEMDWCGPCYSREHSHGIPSSPIEHANAIYEFAQAVRDECPGLLTEVHDPIWPWLGCTYVPTYFRQGSGRRGCYDENWGFEFWVNCINDLRSGRAMSLYYYNLGSNIPIYLHITMAGDNDNCLFFWWAASTVRHLGIGGRSGHETTSPKDRPAYNREQRYDSYRKHMRTYKSLKPYFVRGIFWGIAENIHIHTLPEKNGAVVNIFNISDEVKDLEFEIPKNILGDCDGRVHGAESGWFSDALKIRLELPPMSHGLVCIGDAIDVLCDE